MYKKAGQAITTDTRPTSRNQGTHKALCTLKLKDKQRFCRMIAHNETSQPHTFHITHLGTLVTHNTHAKQ